MHVFECVTVRLQVELVEGYSIVQAVQYFCFRYHQDDRVREIEKIPCRYPSNLVLILLSCERCNTTLLPPQQQLLSVQPLPAQQSNQMVFLKIVTTHTHTHTHTHTQKRNQLKNSVEEK